MTLDLWIRDAQGRPIAPAADKYDAARTSRGPLGHEREEVNV